METMLRDLLADCWPVLRAGAVVAVTAFVGYLTARLKRALDAQERRELTEQAVALAERNPDLTTGGDKLAAVEAALSGTGATRAAIEVAVARLTTSSKTTSKEENACENVPTA
jgi:hypothetical protein